MQRSSKITMIVTAIVALIGGGAKAQGPKLQIAETEWNFGVREMGQIDHKDVTITNVGDQPLLIKSIRASCGCISGAVDDKEIALPPGGQRPLHLTLDTSRNWGPIKKFCYVESNDPSTPMTIFTVEGVINPEWYVTEKNINFGEIDAGTSHEAGFRIVIRRGVQVKILQFTESSPGAKVTRTPFVDPDGKHGWDVKVEIPGEIPVGPFSLNLNIQTDHPLVRYENVMLHARVKGSLKVEPARIYFGQVTSGVPKRAAVRISRLDEPGLEILEILNEESRVKLDKTILEAERAVEIGATLTAEAGDKPLKGRFVIVTNDSKQPRIGIEWQAFPANSVRKETPKAPDAGGGK